VETKRHPLTFEVIERADGVCFLLRGDLFATSIPSLARAIEAAEERQPRSLHLDFTGVDHIDSRGVGALVGWHRHFWVREVDFRLLGVRDDVLHVLRVCNLVNLFAIGLPAPDSETQRRRQGEALWRSHEYAEQILSALGEGLVVLDTRWRTLLVNPDAEKILGREEIELLGAQFEDVVPLTAAMRTQLERANGKSSFLGEVMILRGDESVPIQILATPIKMNGQPAGILLGLQDVRAKRAAEEELRRFARQTEDARVAAHRALEEMHRSEQTLARRERYLAALAQVQQALLANHGETDLDRRILRPLGVAAGASRTYLFENHRDEAGRLLMSQRAEWCAEGIPSEMENPILQDCPYDRGFQRWQETLSRGEPISGLVAEFPDSEREILDPQGILSILILPLVVHREFVGFIGFDNCVAARVWDPAEVDLLRSAASAISLSRERILAERALSRSEAIYRAAIENASGVPYRLLYRDEHYEFMGEGIEKLVGVPANNLTFERFGAMVRERVVTDPLGSSDCFEYGRAFRAGIVPRFQADFLVVTPAGEQRWLSDCAVPVRDEPTGQIIGAFGILQDITSRKHAEETLRKASRLEATATLAGGIAHDFNNLMVGVLGNASLVLSQLGPGHSLARMVRDIETAAERASHLAQQLLAFARGGKYAPQPLNLNDTVREAVAAQSRALPSGVKIECDLAEDLWSIRADPTQMMQVAMNLCLNAIEAIEEGGLITVTTRNVLLDERGAEAMGELLPGPHVALTVEDTGRGIPRENLNRVFEPFFTTKGQGRGLGLAAIYGIVHHHGGHVEVQSEEGRGSTFVIHFPAILPGRGDPPSR
jgi:two-component system NtrC family sensor kinase